MKSLSLVLCTLLLFWGMMVVGCEKKPPQPTEAEMKAAEDKKAEEDRKAKAKAEAEAKKNAEPAETTESLNMAKKQELGSIMNLSVWTNFYLAGQPKEADIELLKEKQIQIVINLRGEDESLGFDEAKTVADAGIKYANPSFSSPETMTDEKIGEIRKLLSDTNNQPMMLHCGSGNRVGAVWMIYRVLDEGWEYDQALKEARGIGLKSPGLEKRAKEYIDKHEASK